jgi:hypothetical protein
VDVLKVEFSDCNGPRESSAGRHSNDVQRAEEDVGGAGECGEEVAGEAGEAGEAGKEDAGGAGEAGERGEGDAGDAGACGRDGP